MLEFQVVDGRDQVKAEPKAFAAISITFTQDAKGFQLAQDIFNQNPLAGQYSLARFLFLAQRMKFCFLGRCLATGVQGDQPLLTAIRQSTSGR